MQTVLLTVQILEKVMGIYQPYKTGSDCMKHGYVMAKSRENVCAKTEIDFVPPFFTSIDDQDLRRGWTGCSPHAGLYALVYIKVNMYLYISINIVYLKYDLASVNTVQARICAGRMGLAVVNYRMTVKSSKPFGPRCSEMLGKNLIYSNTFS